MQAAGYWSFGVYGDGHRFAEIGGAIDEHVTDALAVAEDRDATVLFHESDKLFGAARNQQIDFVLEMQKFHYVGAGLQERDGILRDIGKCGERLFPDGEYGFVAIGRFGATFEENGVAGLERERSDLGDDIGTRFEDDGDHAERAGFFEQDQPLVEFGGCEALAEWVRQVGHFPDAGGHFGDTGFFHAQPGKQGWGHFSSGYEGFRSGTVFGVGCENSIGIFFERVRDDEKRGGTGFVRKECEFSGGLARSTSDEDDTLWRFGGGSVAQDSFSRRTILSRVKSTRAEAEASLAKLAIPRANSFPSTLAMLTTSMGPNGFSTRTTPEESRLALPREMARCAPASTTTRPRTPAA